MPRQIEQDAKDFIDMSAQLGLFIDRFAVRHDERRVYLGFENYRDYFNMVSALGGRDKMPAQRFTRPSPLGPKVTKEFKNCWNAVMTQFLDEQGIVYNHVYREDISRSYYEFLNPADAQKFSEISNNPDIMARTIELLASQYPGAGMYNRAP